jgi:hypothetical protein
MSRHTPGPWIFGIRNYDDECKPGFIEKPFDYKGPGFFDNPGIFGADGTEVVGCDEYLIFNSPDNARLIAAAPDLLEALKACIPHLERDDHHTDALSRERPHYAAARAAIAKATGAA